MHNPTEPREDAIQALRDSGESAAYAAIAFGLTATTLHFAFGVESKAAVEPAVLNAGIAYYTHAATGRILRALVVLIPPAAAKVAAPVKRATVRKGPRA